MKKLVVLVLCVLVTAAAFSFPASAAMDAGTVEDTASETTTDTSGPEIVAGLDALNEKAQDILSIQEQLDARAVELLEHIGYIEAFMLFFVVAALCFFVYKFFRMFF